MNEFKGTPGPWTVEKHSGEEYGPKENCSFAIKGPPLAEELPGLQLATVISDCIEAHEANALLIAASPKLFKAVNDFLNHFEGDIPLWLFEEAEGAVAEALGK